jgi:GNAT superfamily N-acetyltransferase
VTSEPRLRLATTEDADAIDALMKASIRAIFPAFYDERQTESAVRYVGEVDRTLIDDRTYFVVEEDGDLVACGGWSRRDKLYTGSGAGVEDARRLDPATEPARVRAMFVRGDRTRRGLGTMIIDACRDAARSEGFERLALMATLPGLQLYERYGFRIGQRTDIPMPDGSSIAGAAMEMPIAPPTSAISA